MAANNEVASALDRTEEPAQPVHVSGKHKSDVNSRVRHFGEDVTVRYFDPRPVALHTTLREGNERHISDDVTVRYFGPRPVSAPEPTSGEHQPVTR